MSLDYLIFRHQNLVYKLLSYDSSGQLTIPILHRFRYTSASFLEKVSYYRKQYASDFERLRNNHSRIEHELKLELSATYMVSQVRDNSLQ